MELNASFFVEPERSRQIRYAKQGLLSPEEDKLRPGLMLYRVGHSSLSEEENFSSPWWMDYEAYIKIKKFAETNHTSLTVSHRVQNAVAHRFGGSNILYKVQLRATLRAFIGAGRPIESDGRYSGRRTT